MSVDSLGGLSEIDVRLAAMAIRLSHPGVIDIEDAKQVVVGQRYFVNVVTTRKDCPAAGAHFPVLGDEHDDSDFILIFPDNVPHWHVDWRFIPSELYPKVVAMFLGVFGQNAERQNALSEYKPGTKNLQLACVLPASVVVSVQRWPLPVFRQQLRWEAVPEWLAPLEAAYKDKKVCNNVCPHRGISLTGAPEDQYGNRVCPGHGLKWSKSGCLVPRSNSK